jgi:hypothetical protein
VLLPHNLWYGARTMAVDVAQLAAPPKAAPAGLFISTPAKDVFFYFASVLVVGVVWFLASQLHVNSFYILAGVAAVSNGPHLASTWTRVYFDKREWRERPLLIVGMPLAIALGVVLITQYMGIAGTRLLNSTILYWATWHFVAQNWGIMRIYQRKSGEPLTSIAMRLERPILFMFVAWCLLKRIDTGPRILFGTEVLYYRLPTAVVDGLWGPLAFLMLVYLVQRVRERNQPWAKAAWLRGVFLLCAFAGFFIPFICIKTDDTSAFAAAACWHGIQYLGIVRHYHNNSFKIGVSRDAPIISWLAQPGRLRLFLYLALLWALAGSGYLVIFGGTALTKGTPWTEYRWAGVVWITFTLSHYWLDGVIWKLRKPELAQRVGITT